MLLVLALVCASVLSGQMLEASLDGHSKVRSASGEFQAALLQGADYVASAEGNGVTPGPSGPALTIPVPDDFWQIRGTLEFRFALDRRVRFTAKPLAIPLMDAPILRVTLRETSEHPVIEIGALTSSGKSETGVLNLTRLDAGEWYHFAVTWDADDGVLAAYLNGESQGELRPLAPNNSWRPARRMGGVWHLGGSAGLGEAAVRVSIDEPRLYANVRGADELKSDLEDRGVVQLNGEARTAPAGPLDLQAYKLTPLFEADFSQPLNVVDEADVFDGRSRRPPPPEADWVFEGLGSASVSDGKLFVEGRPDRPALNSVLWSSLSVPDGFLLEFEAAADVTAAGSLGVLFSATTRSAADIFEGRLVRRSGVMESYTLGALNNYQLEYGSKPDRGSTELYRNAGHHLVAIGSSTVPTDAGGIQRVRLLKAEGRVQLEVNGQVRLDYTEEDDEFGGPLGQGRIGLRQFSEKPVAYRNFRISKVEAATGAAN